VRLDDEQRTPLPVQLENTLRRWAQEHVREIDACILSDYAKGVLSTTLTAHLIHSARQAGKPVIVDPKGVDYAKYRGADVVTPNIHEAERALNRQINGDADLMEVGRQLSDLFGGAALLITRGSQGMSLFLKGTYTLHIPASARSVFDVTGAGDTVVGTLAMALAADASLEQAAYLANRAAGIVVEKFGTATPTLEELTKDGG
jgi:D-beta-D-heptose 7-phosphate kinase/D-beta-D-heptose 1-phosphate adenosyltransferase